MAGMTATAEELACKKRPSEYHGNVKHTTVAAFLPWRGSHVYDPWPLTVLNGCNRILRSAMTFLAGISEDL
jgi:hypothetical protein